MKFRWLLHGLLSGLSAALVLSTTAIAGELQTWQFDRTDNRLTFTTTAGVQPTAQLIANPTRLVIDLPGTTIQRTTSRQSLSGLVREVRVGQFNAQTARIVIELAPGYTLDPTEIRIRGLTDRQWSVELPDPTPGTVATPGTPSPTTPATPTAPITPVDAPIQLDALRETPDGLFLRLRGGQPQLEIDRDEDDRTITIDVLNAALSDRLAAEQRTQAFERDDLSRVDLSQVEDATVPTARIVLTLPEDAPDWDVTVSNLGGLVLIPRRGTTLADGDRVIRPAPTTPTAPTPPPQAERPATPPVDPNLATISSILLSSDGRQLQIRGDRTTTYTSGPNAAEGAYEVRIAGAQLAEDIQGPPLEPNSPVQRVRLRQEDDTVVVLITPAPGIRFGTIRRAQADQAAVLVVPLNGTVVAAPGNPITPPRPGTIPTDLPTVPRGRLVVVVDPGHGGPDPGAIGINGLREKDVIFPISQEVAALLEQQGVQVIMTRTDDRDLGLEPRVQLAQRVNATLFVSIHANAISLSRPDVNGLEVYYYSSSASQRLADTVRRSILQTVPIRDRGVRSARFYVLRNTSMPAILVETGFVTGAEDARNLSDPAHRSLMAQAIARGVLTYLQQNY